MKTKNEKPRPGERWYFAIHDEKINLNPESQRVARGTVEKIRAIRKRLQSFAREKKRHVKQFMLDDSGKVVAIFSTRIPEKGILKRRYTPDGAYRPAIIVGFKKQTT